MIIIEGFSYGYQIIFKDVHEKVRKEMLQFFRDRKISKVIEVVKDFILKYGETYNIYYYGGENHLLYIQKIKRIWEL